MPADSIAAPPNPVVIRPASAAWIIGFGAVGGVLASALALGAATLGLMRDGRAPVAALNTLGAWSVRWLQTAAPPALDNFYPDATLVGLGLAVAGGALLGAVLAGVMERFPDDHAVAWGVVLALITWAAARWALGPALNPLYIRSLGPWLGAACLIYGAGVGLWVHAGRLLMETRPDHR